MDNTAWLWFFLNILTLFMSAFFSMAEMAAVTFNKVRLHYYVAKGNIRAEWLNWLLLNPTRLFGTTLISVNVAMFFGSEFAREFHRSIGINPDFSPLTQVFLVVIFGELAPMFAARRYPEHVVMLTVPIVYITAKAMIPILWALEGITYLFTLLTGTKKTHSNIYLTQEELQKILEEQDVEHITPGSGQDLNAETSNIFKLSQKNLSEVMEPLATITKAPSNSTVAQASHIFQNSEEDYIAIYHQDMHNIVGITYAQDLVRAQENKRLRDFARPPWFVTESTPLMSILNQFRRNNENLGVVLNNQGQALGVIHLFDILEEIFEVDPQKIKQTIQQVPFIERTLPGSMTVGDFNTLFDVLLDPRQGITLSELITEILGHEPSVGDSIYLEPFDLTVESAGLLEVKSVKVTTRI